MAWFDAHVLWANPEIAWVFALVARYGGRPWLYAPCAPRFLCGGLSLQHNGNARVRAGVFFYNGANTITTSLRGGGAYSRRQI